MIDRAPLYGALLAFCILSAARDVLSEILFKNDAYSASPIFVLFIYSAVTQVLALVIIAFNRTKLAHISASVLSLKREICWVNFFSLTAFLSYFAAINLPLGAAANALVDYGSGPLFTAVIGALLAGEQLDKRFGFCATVATIGVVILSVPRLGDSGVSGLWMLGLCLALLSSLSSGFYRVYFRILLRRGLDKSVIVLVRLAGITIVLGTVLLWRQDLFRVDLLWQTVVLGLVGFALPLFLVLTILQRVPIRHFAMFLFLLPAITIILSSLAGYTTMYFSDIAAALIILFGVVVYEGRSR